MLTSGISLVRHILVGRALTGYNVNHGEDGDVKLCLNGHTKPKGYIMNCGCREVVQTEMNADQIDTHLDCSFDLYSSSMLFSMLCHATLCASKDVQARLGTMLQHLRYIPLLPCRSHHGSIHVTWSLYLVLHIPFPFSFTIPFNSATTALILGSDPAFPFATFFSASSNSSASLARSLRSCPRLKSVPAPTSAR